METDDGDKNEISDSEMLDVNVEEQEEEEREKDYDSSGLSDDSDEFNLYEQNYDDSSDSSGEFEFGAVHSSVKSKQESNTKLTENEMNDFLDSVEASSKTIKTSDAYEIYSQYNSQQLPNSIKLLSISETLLEPCCGEMCCLKFTPEFVMRARLRIPTSDIDKAHLFQFIIIQNCTTINGTFSPKINEIPICEKFFQRLYAIPKDRFDKFLEELSMGFNEPLPHGNKGRKFEHASTSLRCAQILDIIDGMAEPNPADSSFIMPTGTTRTDTIKKCNLNSKVKINPTQEFKRIKKTFRFHKSHGHKRCRICTLLKTAKKNSKLSNELRKTADLHLYNHYTNITNDNRCYEIRGLTSKQQPNFFLSIAHDGMSKEKTKFPRLHESNTKKLADAMKIMCSLNLGLVHRTTQDTSYQLHCFWNIDQIFGAKANAVISQLFFTISHCDPIPTNISVQLDNCGSNKCYTLFGAFGLLLLWIPELKNIYICTSEVGHTHNDVDQKFGVLATALKSEEVFTPQGYTRIAERKLKGLKTNNLFPTTYDFETLIKENVDQNGKIFKNHFFELSKLENDTVVMKIARFLRSEKYLSNNSGDSPAFPLFKERPNANIFPEIIPPNEFDMVKHTTLCKAVYGSINPEDYDELKNLPKFIKENYIPEPFENLLKRISEKVVTTDINVTVPEDPENELIEEFINKISKPWDEKQPQSAETPSTAKPKKAAQPSTKRKTSTPKASSEISTTTTIYCNWK